MIIVFFFVVFIDQLIDYPINRTSLNGYAGWIESFREVRFLTLRIKNEEVHYENMPIQIYWKFYHHKMKFFR